MRLVTASHSIRAILQSNQAPCEVGEHQQAHRQPVHAHVGAARLTGMHPPSGLEWQMFRIRGPELLDTSAISHDQVNNTQGPRS